VNFKSGSYQYVLAIKDDLRHYVELMPRHCQFSCCCWSSAWDI